MVCQLIYPPHISPVSQFSVMFILSCCHLRIIILLISSLTSGTYVSASFRRNRAQRTWEIKLYFFILSQNLVSHWVLSFYFLSLFSDHQHILKNLFEQMAIINIITAFHVPGISLLTVMYAILPASYDDNVNLNFLPCIFFISDCIWNRCVCTYIYMYTNILWLLFPSSSFLLLHSNATGMGSNNTPITGIRMSCQ